MFTARHPIGSSPSDRQPFPDQLLVPDSRPFFLPTTVEMESKIASLWVAETRKDLTTSPALVREPVQPFWMRLPEHQKRCASFIQMMHKIKVTHSGLSTGLSGC